ncbi:MAG: membrane or secreted protein [Bacteroidota bacterium]
MKYLPTSQFRHLNTFSLVALLISFVALSAPIQSQAQDELKVSELIGAWSSIITQQGHTLTQVAIVDAAYMSVSIFDQEQHTFHGTYGGQWQLEGDEMTLTFEFNTISPGRVGSTQTAKVLWENGQIRFADDEVSWERIDDGTPGALPGAWLITGRERNGEMRERQIGPRKTMKILSGTRFQWIAYNTETKEFKGTGGGTYTTVDGKYTETIEFFSRDGNRVGAVLPFDFSLQNDKWHHEGLSSKGSPIHEVWTLRIELDNQAEK